MPTLIIDNPENTIDLNLPEMADNNHDQQAIIDYLVALGADITADAAE